MTGAPTFSTVRLDATHAGSGRLVRPIPECVNDPERKSNGQWAKGTSGNPGGRKKPPMEAIETARGLSGVSFETLVDVARNSKNDMARVKAAELLLNRAYGAPGKTDIPSDEDSVREFAFDVGAERRELRAVPPLEDAV